MDNFDEILKEFTTPTLVIPQEDILDAHTKYKFAAYIVDGYSAREAGGLCSIENPYFALAQCQDEIRLFEGLATGGSRQSSIAKREEVMEILTAMIRNSGDANIKLRAIKELLSQSKSADLTIKQLLANKGTVSDCSVVIHLPSQDPSPTMDSQSK